MVASTSVRKVRYPSWRFVGTAPLPVTCANKVLPKYCTYEPISERASELFSLAAQQARRISTVLVLHAKLASLQFAEE